MSDEVWQRDEIESPCVKICVVNPKARLCVGCWRSLDEIRDWTRMTPQERRDVMAQAPQREASLAPKRRGGAQGRRQDGGKTKD